MFAESDPALHIRRLRVQGDAAAIQELIELLDDPERAGNAALALAQLKAGAAVAKFIHRFEIADDLDERRFWIDTLGVIGSPLATSTLLGVLEDPEPKLVVEACDALGELADVDFEEASGALYTMLEHPDWMVRAAACSVLMDHGIADGRIATALAQLASEPEAHETGFRLSALQREFAELNGQLAEFVSRQHAQWLAAAREELDSPSPEVRRRAVSRLQGHPDPEAIGLLLRAFNDPSPHVRSTVPLSMSLEHSAAAIPALIHHLQADDSLRVRAMCAYKLGFQRDARILAPLVQALNSPDWKLVTMAIIGLRNLGDSAAAPHLLPVLDHAQWSLRRDACAALLGFGVGDPRILRTLEQLAREPEAVEWDLSAAESVRDLPMMREFAEEGDPEPQPLPTMAELIQQAEQILNAT